MKATANFNFYCRASKVNKDGLSPIEVSVIINGKRRFINLPIKCTPKQFNSKRKPKEIQEYLDAMRNNINHCIIIMAQNQMPLTIQNLSEAIKNGGIVNYTIDKLFADYDKILIDKLGKDMDINHYKKYTLTRDLFYTIVDKNKEADSITNSDILMFQNTLNKKMKESTAAGYMSRLKSYIRFGMNNSKIHTDPFAGIKIKRVEKPVQTITEDELNTILNKKIDNERLTKVKDLFLFSCGTGLAFADVCNLRPTDFSTSNGKTIITKSRQKTDIMFYSVVLDFAVDIAKKYNYDFSDILMSNQKVNCYLKEIQTICGINSVSSLHFHLARHYYATNAINAGVPLEVVQKLVGHSNIKQTQHYAHLMQATVLKNVMEHIDKL